MATPLEKKLVAEYAIVGDPNLMHASKNGKPDLKKDIKGAYDDDGGFVS